MIKIPDNFFSQSKNKFKILLISGGHGSSHFIESIWKDDFSKQNIVIKTLFNPFDDGASYGIIRDVLDVSCMGDGRKNQYKMFMTLYGDKLPHNIKTIYNMLFDTKFVIKSFDDIFNIITRINYLVTLNEKNNETDYNFTKDGLKYLNIILDNIKHFVKTYGHHIYDTNTLFNISNMFYAMMEYNSGNSSQQDILNAISQEIFKLGDNGVIISLNDSAYIKSVTKEYNIIKKETPDIIDFRNNSPIINDSIIKQTLYTKHGKLINYYLDKDIKNYILNSNIILICPGTLYSSINPTFIQKNIKELFINSTAKKLLYVNDEPDTDYFINNTINLQSNLLNYYSNTELFRDSSLSKQITKIYKYSDNILNVNFIPYDDITYGLLSYYFFNTFIHKITLNKMNFIFDYDGTIWSQTDKENSDNIINELNKKNKNNVFVSTGNYVLRNHNKILNIKNIFTSNVFNKDFKSKTNKYYNKGFELNKNILENKLYMYDYPIKDLLFNERVNDIITTIKHVDNKARHLISADINRRLDDKEFKTYCLGKTSIDFIYDKHLKYNLSKIIDFERSIYIGDGVNNPYSNDYKIASQTKLKINVNTLTDTFLFIKYFID